MSFIRTLIALITAVISLLSGTSSPLISQKDIDMNKFELVWSDEFDGNSLDESKWTSCHHGKNQTLLRKGGYWNMDFVTV